MGTTQSTRRRPNFEKDHKIKIVRGIGFEKINDLGSKVKVNLCDLG